MWTREFLISFFFEEIEANRFIINKKRKFLLMSAMRRFYAAAADQQPHLLHDKLLFLMTMKKMMMMIMKNALCCPIIISPFLFHFWMSRCARRDNAAAVDVQSKKWKRSKWQCAHCYLIWLSYLRRTTYIKRQSLPLFDPHDYHKSIWPK